MVFVRRAVIYLVLAAIAGLIGGVALAGELGADVSTVDGVIVGTHTGRVSGANGGSTTVYYVDVERQDTLEHDSVRNAGFYDAYQASHDTHVTLEIRATGPDVDRIAAAHYLGRTYDATTKAEGVGVAIAFLVLSAVFLALAIRRALVARRAPSPTQTTPSSAGGVWGPPSGSPTR
ncbi:MAG: hypothetical protein QOJ66_2394 [Ilumatobacteraceae bacterium]